MPKPNHNEVMKIIEDINSGKTKTFDVFYNENCIMRFRSPQNLANFLKFKMTQEDFSSCEIIEDNRVWNLQEFIDEFSDQIGSN